MGSAVTILLIEDDKALAELIATFLETEGFRVVLAGSAEAAMPLLSAQEFDLIICDIMLPGQDGFDFYPTLTRLTQAPVIFMTALAESQDEIRGLELGAVDYISKPVVPALLLARIKARLRRGSESKSQQWQHHEVSLNLSLQQLTVGERAFPLTTQETALLWIFVHALDQVLSREYLFEQFVGRSYDGLDRAIDLKISRLRKKLDGLDIPLTIKTVHGRGYLLSYHDGPRP
ncbi:response regulator transcription factor [Shewanella sedimentimangrovi]|uniref:Response regulator transcription factor n=1 Tax=Shewanella sedimentimangrovi TaxID=2814293 RepID=A0ABX7R1Y4_9GAMM|nr:response regulator transcription factor [Shewanella sedimentimangrovi]QSX37788.1 response regulator transcription factor [Shewanella sedimentimangrovi]